MKALMIYLNQLPRPLWGVLFAAYCLLIYVLSNQSQLPVPDVFESQDKLIHSTAYAGMAWLFWQTWQGKLSNRLLPLYTVFFCSLYGVTDEWHQSFIVGRDASFFDWLADTLGAMLLVFFRYKKRISTLHSSL
ncbi:MAG: VanZ family protein [Mariprofundus sp.]|nr:VanZ family protein [Mariprofundus sp.]